MHTLHGASFTLLGSSGASASVPRLKQGGEQSPSTLCTGTRKWVEAHQSPPMED